MRANAMQAALWNGPGGQTWVDHEDGFERQLAPLGQAAIAALAPQRGERILDIGCGSGGTSRELARLVGPEGAVVGVDISAPLLDLARKRSARIQSLDFVEGDAQSIPLQPRAFDAVFSRFGVMFFDDPVAGFRNIHHALKPGARLSFVCWRGVQENPIFSLPLAAAAAFIPPPVPTDPNMPGPFAFSDADRIDAILAQAGFTALEICPQDHMVSMGDLETSVRLALRSGLLGSIIGAQPDLYHRVRPAVTAALSAHQTGNGVELAAAVWIVTGVSG